MSMPKFHIISIYVDYQLHRFFIVKELDKDGKLRLSPAEYDALLSKASIERGKTFSVGGK